MTFIQFQKTSLRTASLEESLFLELGNPCFGAVLGQIVLVVFVEHASAELAILNLGLGFDVFVSLGGGQSVNLGSSGGELVVQFGGGIAVVVRVRLLVSASKDGNLLSLKTQVGKGIVKPFIPGSSRTAFVLASVPGWGTDNDAVFSLDGIIGRITCN